MAAVDISQSTTSIFRVEASDSRYSDANLSLPAFFFIRSLKRCRATTLVINLVVSVRDFALDVFLDLRAERVSQRVDVLFNATAASSIFDTIFVLDKRISTLLHTCPRGCDD
jgi:hypothetical protein